MSSCSASEQARGRQHGLGDVSGEAISRGYHEERLLRRFARRDEVRRWPGRVVEDARLEAASEGAVGWEGGERRQRHQRRGRAHSWPSRRMAAAAATLAEQMEGRLVRATGAWCGMGVRMAVENRACECRERMNGPDAGERDGLSARGLCAAPKDKARREG